jgi:ataxin-10
MSITDSAAAASLSENVDQLIVLAQTDAVLSVATIKFQLEHSTAKVSYEQGGGDGGGPKQHLARALNRMFDFALAVSVEVLARALAHAASTASSPGGSSPPTSPMQHADSPDSGHGGGMLPRASSVEDVGSDAYFARQTTMAHVALEVLATVFLVSEDARPLVQRYAAADTAVVAHLRDALGVPRDVELASFAEGYKTQVMAALSNLAYACAAVGDAVAADDALLAAVLSGTRVDEENPGMVEWAEFAIRNICLASGKAQDAISSLKARTSRDPATGKAVVEVDRSTKEIFGEQDVSVMVEGQRLNIIETTM